MNFASYVALLVILALVSISIIYMVKEKKKGNRCIGCPYSDDCKAKYNPFRVHQTRF